MIAVVVVSVFVPVPPLVAAAIAIPAMVVIVVSARRVPVTLEIPASFPIRLYPI